MLFRAQRRTAQPPRSADGAEDRQHLQADHFRGAVHVSVQRGTVGIVGGRQVHSHRGEEVVEILPWMPYLRAVSTTAASDGSPSSVAPVTIRLNSSSSQPLQLVCTFGGGIAGSKSSRMSSARRAKPYSACTAGRCCGASNRVARKKVLPCCALSVRHCRYASRKRRIAHTGGMEFGTDHGCTTRDWRRLFDDAGDPVGGQAPRHQRRRNTDPWHCRRSGEHGVVDPAHGVRRPERSGLAEGVGQRERRTREHALAGPARGVDDVQQFCVDPERRHPVANRAQMLVGVGRTRCSPIDLAHSGIRRRSQYVEQVATGRAPAARHPPWVE